MTTEVRESDKYESMLTRVEEIIIKLSNDVDLDSVILHVEEGYNLIKKMKSRLLDTKLKLEKLRVENEIDIEE